MELYIFAVLVFIWGYLGIVFEHPLKTNKTFFALFGAALIWSGYAILSGNTEIVLEELSHHLSKHSEIIFFLIGAMTIVELVDAHEGFRIIQKLIKVKNKRKLLWITSGITFFLSALLDNLTTTIVMITILRKIIPNQMERMIFVGMVVICANAGGAWSPIGDVTTTMLWIGGQISAFNIMKTLILPSLVNAFIPLVVLSFSLKGDIEESKEEDSVTKNGNIMFFVGILGLIFVPIFKVITHLPPYMGIILSLSVVWFISERLDSTKDDADQKKDSVRYSLSRVDWRSVLFFLGILLMVSCLESLGILSDLSLLVDSVDLDVRFGIIGVLSAVVDNVPLVAASQGMYPLDMYPTDHKIWEGVAYAAGTGGSIFIIGSAAGIVAMGMEKINFIWYFKNISLLAFLGFVVGLLAYLWVYPYFAVH